MIRPTPEADQDVLSGLLTEAAQSSIQFQKTLHERSVAAPNRTAPPVSLGEDGVGAQEALSLFEQHIAPHLSASAGPRYLGYVTGGVTPAALMGDWLASAVDQNPVNPGCSVAPLVIEQSIGMLASLFNLPFAPDAPDGTGFDGTFTSGAQGANTLAAACFRDWAGERCGTDVTEEGVAALTGLEIYCASPHITMGKSLGIVGLGRNAMRSVARVPGREAMDPQALEEALANSDALSKVVIASAGIVSTGDFEDIQSIAASCARHDAWLHVDGAFGLFARCSPHYAALAKGIEHADSITTDCHKWLNVPYDCGLFLTRHLDRLETSMRLTASYLKTDDPAPTYINRGLESSSRFRALPVWMALMAYGRSGVRDMVERSCDMAQRLGDMLSEIEGYELLAPTPLNIVLFRGTFGSGADQDDLSNALQADLMKAINATGKVFLTPGVFDGKAGMRAAFSNWKTGPDDLPLIIEALRQGREHVLKAKG